MNATQFYVQEQARRYEASCRSAAAQVRMLTTIPDVVRAATVVAPPVLRGLASTLPGHRGLKDAVLRRLEELIAKQVQEVRKENDPEKRKQLVGKLRLREWSHLRGMYAMQWRIADREAQVLLAQRS